MFRNAIRLGFVARAALVVLGCFAVSHAAFGQTTLNWTLVREGHPNLNGVASNGTIYVMVADYGEIYTSTDGIAWSKQVPDAARRSIRAVTWAQGQFVAVGDGVVLTSPDGQAWTARDMTLPGTGGALHAVTGSASRYVAVGGGGQVAWSADGITWTAGSSGTTASLMDVAFGGGVFVAVGGRNVLTSPDGSTWSPVTSIPSGDPWAQVRAVAYTGSTFVAIGGEPSTYTPLAMTSPDGQAWTRQSISAGWKVSGVVTGNGMVMTFDGQAYVSADDGLTWTIEPLPSGGPGASSSLSAGAYGPEGFVACGRGGALYTAPGDGSPWTARTLDASRPLWTMAEGDGVLCAVGDGLARSTDGGATWVNLPVPDASPLGQVERVVFANGLFVAAAMGNAIYSPDCETWAQGNGILNSIPELSGCGLNDVAFGAGQLVAVGQGALEEGNEVLYGGPVLFTSTDGMNWVRRDPGLSQPEDFGIASVAYGNGRWVATAGRGTDRVLLTSEDAVQWTPRSWPFGDNGADVRFVNARFLAANQSFAWTSADGLEWTSIAWPGSPGALGPHALGAVAYGAGRYLVQGGNGTLHLSTDLVHWTPNATGTGHTLWAAVYLEDLNRFVAVGDSAIVYSSGSPAVSVGDASVTEGHAGETDMTFTVTLYDGAGAPVSVDYATADGSATAGIDYTPASGQLTLDGTPMSSQTVVVKVRGDEVPEADETFRLNLLSATGASIDAGPGTGTILTDDGTLSISDGAPRNVTEGNAGLTPVEFTVTLANSTGSDPVTVQYASASSSFAVAGLDFEAVGGTLTLAPPDDSRTITVNVFGDTLGENNESFVVRLSNPVNAWIARDTGIATIVNDDPPPTVAIDDVTVTEGNDGTRTAYFSVYLSSYFNQPITFDYATSDGTATSGSDYLASAGSVTINPGQSSVPIAISIIGDAVQEGTETFTVTISNARSGTEPISITKEVGTGTILDDEGVVLPSTAATWTLVQEGMPQLYGVASDGSQYVLVGAYGEIWTSPDGVAWTQGANPDRNPASGAARTLRGVTYGDGLWVAVGQWDSLTSDAGRRYPIVLTSTDGATWTPRDVSAATQNTNRNLLGVAYGTGLYVAVGNGGCGPSNARTTCILTSPDGASWTYRPSPTNVSLNAVAFGEPSGGGRFVAVGPNRIVLTSSNGTTWSYGDVPSTMPFNLNAVAWNGTQFVVVGGDASGLSPGIMTSPDGLAWTRQGVPPEMSNAFNGVGSGGGVTVAVAGASSADPTGTAIVTSSSSDGVTWTRRSLKSIPPGVAPWPSTVGFGPRGFVAGGTRTLYTSPNGTAQWTSGTLSSSRLHNGVAFGNGVFCSVGTNGAIRRSTDGVVWTQASSPPDPRAYGSWNPVIYAVGRFWAVGMSLSIASSADCDTWSVRYPATPLLPTDPVTGWWNDLAYGRLGSSDVLVAVGRRFATPGVPGVSSPAIFSSTDGGATWAERSPVFPAGVQQRLVTVAYGNGRFVAFGMESATGEPFLNTSDDGVTWTARPTDVFDKGSYDTVNDLAWGNGLFVAVGSSIRTSPDGVSWTLRKSRSDGAESFMGVAYGGERFVAVGNSGTAYVSADGIVWTPGSAPTDHQLRAAAVSPALNRVVAVGDSAVAYADLAPPVLPPEIAISDASTAEGRAAGTLGFVVSLSRAGEQTVTVQYATANGTATAGSDYQAATGTLTFLPGETRKTLGIGVLGDGVYEKDETVFVNLSSPTNATVGDGSGQGTILNDDAKPTVTIKDAGVLEGPLGTTPLKFTVTLSAASGTPATVSWTTRDGSATAAGQDYVAGSGVLVFNPGETSKTVTVLVKGDRTRESNETFFVDLAQPVDVVISGGTAKGTIKNDD